MLENQSSNEVAVDRREETVRMDQPGYSSTQQVTQDVAGTQRLQLFQVTRAMWLVLGMLEILLGLRFILKLIAANPGNGFAGFIYGLTATFTEPFDALLGTPSIDGSIFETTTLIAMSVYAIIFGFVGRLILLIGDQPRSRSVARSVQEQIPSNEAVINADRIDRQEPPHLLRAVKLPIVTSAPKKELLFHAYSKLRRRYQHLMTLKTNHQAHLKAQSILVDAAESINVQQLPGDMSLDQIARANQAESINVEQLPGDPSLAEINHTDRPRIIRVVKLPIGPDADHEDPLLRSYREFVQRHQAVTNLPKPKISLT